MYCTNQFLFFWQWINQYLQEFIFFEFCPESQPFRDHGSSLALRAGDPGLWQPCWRPALSSCKVSLPLWPCFLWSFIVVYLWKSNQRNLEHLMKKRQQQQRIFRKVQEYKGIHIMRRSSEQTHFIMPYMYREHFWQQIINLQTKCIHICCWSFPLYRFTKKT